MSSLTMKNSKNLSKNSAIFLAVVLVVGTISTIIPPSFAQPDYRNTDPYARDPYANDPTGVNIQKIKCVNSNVNVNGIEITEIPQNGDVTTAEAANEGENALDSGNTQNGLDEINFDKNLVNICANINLNEQINENEITCEDCFTENLDAEELQRVLNVLERLFDADLEELCEFLSTSPDNQEKLLILLIIVVRAEIPDEDILAIAQCLEELGLIDLSTT